MKTRKVKSAGRFRASYGSYVREKITDVESKQKKAQKCPFCGKCIKRISKGIWQCEKCGKKIASHAYYINK